MSLLRKLLGLLVLVAATTAFASAPVKPFTTESYAAILAAHRDQPLVVAFWSLDCAHCPGSLATLARFARAHPKVSVVLVATDTGVDPAALASHVRQAALAQAESKGLLERDGGHLRPTVRGFDFLSDLQAMFLPSVPGA